MIIRTIIALFLITLGNFAHASCLSYGSAIVTLSGTLERMTHPGPPNYEDITKGDAEETGYYLLLSEPVCTVGDSSRTGEGESFDSYPQEGVTLVQLVIDKSGYEEFRPFLGQKISIQGAIFAAFSGHHHAPLLIQKVSIVKKLSANKSLKNAP